MTKRKNILIILGVMLIVAIPVSSQVTMGSQKVPETFSLLELISNSQRGLRLPQLTGQQRTALEQSADFQNQKTGLAKGLTIFNTDTNCMETWTGSQWISLCKAGTIGALGCASVTGVNVTQGIAAVATASLPYSGMTGANINLTDGTVLGSVSGLSVAVNGAQTISAAAGNIAIKIAGTATVSGTINIPISLAGASCNIGVISAVNPSNLPTGTGSFTGRACFDVVMTNEAGDCGLIKGRVTQRANFAQSAVNTQIYTFTISGTVSNIRFYAIDPTGIVIESFSPEGYPGTNLSGTRTVTVKYFDNLNSTAAGLSRENALKATLYVVYNDAANGNGVDRQLQQQVAVQDCSCCPGYLSVGGEYVQTNPGYINSWGTGSNFATIAPYFTATGKSVCFFKTNNPVGPIDWATATNYCTNNMDPTWAYLGWRLPTVAELGFINNNIALNLSTQPSSVAGTENMLTTPAGGGSGAAYYWSSTQSSAPVDWGWSYGQGVTQMVAVSGNTVNTRCVTTNF